MVDKYSQWLYIIPKAITKGEGLKKKCTLSFTEKVWEKFKKKCDKTFSSYSCRVEELLEKDLKKKD